MVPTRYKGIELGLLESKKDENVENYLNYFSNDKESEWLANGQKENWRARRDHVHN